MLAQLSSSVSDDQIRLVIVALLVVAFLLGVATVWFFFHTSPRRRLAARRRVEATTQPAMVEEAAPVRVDHLPHRPDPVSVPVEDPDDEWLRLTAPAARSRPDTNDPRSGSHG